MVTTLYEKEIPEKKHSLEMFHRFSKQVDNGPILLIFESPPFANSTTTNNAELVNLELVVLTKQSSFSEVGVGGNNYTSGIEVVKIGNVTAAANRFGFWVQLHSSIVALNDETVLLLTTDGESLKISKITIPVVPPNVTAPTTPPTSSAATSRWTLKTRVTVDMIPS